MIALSQGRSEAKAIFRNSTLKIDGFYIEFPTVIQYKTGPDGPNDAPTLLYTIVDVFGAMYKGVNRGYWWVTNPYVQVHDPTL